MPSRRSTPLAQPCPGHAAPSGATGDVGLLPPAIATLRDVLIVTDAGLDAPGPRILALAGDVVGLTGYTAQELLGRSPRVFQGRHTPRAALARIRAALERGAACREELLNYRKDGGEYWIELQVSPLRDAGGRVTHFVSLQRDISEWRRLRRAMLEAAQRERDGIARDLHDVLGQELVGISLSIAALDAQLGSVAPAARAVLAEAQQRLGAAIGQTRALAHGLAPIRLGAGGLPGALRVLARALSGAYYVEIVVRAPPRFDVALEPEALGDVYRVAQEAMLNALRHGQPHRITLRLKGAKSGLLLEIEDDGIGFDPGAGGTGLGMDSMRYRARELGGVLEISSQRGRGTRVRLAVGPVS